MSHQPHTPGSAEFWEVFWHIVQFGQIAFLAVIGWLWRKISSTDQALLRIEKEIQAVDQRLLEQKTEIHRDFVTKTDLREIVDTSVTPLRDAINRVDTKLDRLIDRHLQNVNGDNHENH